MRIEDTDRERSTEAATKTILEGLEWLGLTRDEAPVYQSSRAARHAEVAMEMLAAGKAYRCYCTAEELKEMREKAVAKGRSPRYDGRWRDRQAGGTSSTERGANVPEGSCGPAGWGRRRPTSRRRGRAPGEGRGRSRT